MTLYVTDLDGTLLNYAGKVKPRTVKMLNNMIKKGVLFTYATARGFISSRRITAEIELNIPIIAMNGAIIADSNDGSRLHVERLDEKIIKKAKDFFIKKNETPLVYAFINGSERVSYYEKDIKCIKTYLNDRKGDERLRPCESFDEIFEGEIFYFCIINARSGFEELNKIFGDSKVCTANYQKDTYNDEYWYEIFSKNASKANALIKLKEITGADKVVVFGDNANDLSMFEVADECYAVRNALPILKEKATEVIASNEEMGVPVFIEKQTVTIFDYTPPPEMRMEPNQERFKTSLKTALERERTTIGTLNEKLIHATLKGYFTDNIDHEVKIGPYYADALSENGIYEIQTASWGKLCGKLNVFLDACHVTIIYPSEKRVRNIYIHEKTGELIKSSSARTNNNAVKFFFELYRIKEFLTNPNLTICIAELEVEKARFVSDEKCTRKRGQRVEKTPIKLISEVYLQKSEDFRIFLPENLPERFDVKEFSRCAKTYDAKIMLEILEYLNIVHKVDKKGNSFIYSL